MPEIEFSPPRSTEPRAEVVRWLLVLPVAAGASILGLLGRGLLVLLLPTETVASRLAGATIEALLDGGAVYLGAKVAPRAGRWIALVLAASLVAFQGILTAYQWRLSPPYIAITTLVSCATSAWLFWSHGRSGFRRTWRWVAVVLLTVPTIVYIGIAVYRRPAASGPVSGFSKKYRGDGISFRYPPEWELTVGEWTSELGSPSVRELDLNRLGAEGLTIYLIRPPVDDDSVRHQRKLVIPGAEPESPVTETEVVVAGRRLAGARRDYLVTHRGVQGHIRVEIVSVKTQSQTIRVLTMASPEEWPTVEGRFRRFFEQFSFE